MLALGSSPAAAGVARAIACPLQPITSPGGHRTRQMPPAPLPSAAAPSPSATLLLRRGEAHAPRPRWHCPCTCRAARRRVRYGEDEDDVEEQGHNGEIAMIESYSAAARGVALLVHATVDGDEETVLVFKGFSSLLSSGTSSDPVKSVLPARAVILSVDVVRGPFDPSNIEYLERGLAWEAFRSRIGQPGRPQ